MKDKNINGLSDNAWVYSKEGTQRTYRPVVMSLSLFKCNNEALTGKTVLYNIFINIRSNEMAMKVRWPSPWIGALWCAALTLITLWLRALWILMRGIKRETEIVSTHQGWCDALALPQIWQHSSYLQVTMLSYQTDEQTLFECRLLPNFSVIFSTLSSLVRQQWAVIGHLRLCLSSNRLIIFTKHAK